MPHRSAPASPSAESRSHAIFARIVTGFLVILVVLMVAGIYRRWDKVHEPLTAVLIVGDGSLEGAKIEVTGGRQSYSTTLDSDNGWQTPILLDPGYYHVVVKHRDITIHDEQFAVDRVRGRRIDLPSRVVVIGGSQFADAKVEILRDPTPETYLSRESINLESKDHYRTSIYLMPGNYHAIARSITVPERILAQADFVVDRTAPVHVDLVKALNEGAAP